MQSDNKLPVNASLALFAASFLSLFFELLIIRWLSSDFVSFGVFKTFPLVACFVGLGTGVARAELKNFKLAPLALLTCVVTTVVTSFAGYGYVAFPSLSMYQWADPTDKTALISQVLAFTPLIILLLMGPFGTMYGIGNLIGHFFNKLTPLKAYCVDIGGAIAGSITFAALSFLSVSPNWEIVLVSSMMGFLGVRLLKVNVASLLALAASCVVVLLPIFNPKETTWSPYYRMDVQEISLPQQLTKSGKKEDLGIILNTNRGFSQSFTNNNVVELNAEGEKTEAARTLRDFLLVRKEYYELPYSFCKPKEILILGAGSGSDVAEAVKQGVEYIDAVEIDQGVIGLAKKYNPAVFKPQVHYHLDDGRRFLTDTNKKYDLIILACLDSRAVSGSGSSLRTDCYIHTKQSYMDCVKHLKDDGIMVMSFGASVEGQSNWLRDRIFKTLEAVTGYPPIVMSDESAKTKWPAYFFVTGKPVRDGVVKAPEGVKTELGWSTIKMPPSAEVQGIVLDDDWPFLYIREKALDLPYLFVLAVICVITLYVGRRVIWGEKSACDLQLFGLGAAFILLELQAISRLSLLYGATWVTSSVVINGVLIMILASNFAILRASKPFNQNILYIMLFASILGSYFLPMQAVLAAMPGAAGMGTTTFVTLFPVFTAGLIFATAFKNATHPARSFAFNLLGSVLGGLLEYLSTYIGINNLLLVSLVLYLGSYRYMLIAVKEPTQKPEPDSTTDSTPAPEAEYKSQVAESNTSSEKSES